ncbi:MAG: hypothetical protein PUA68_03410 [Bacilli bacterium]|nr:hypothetical protein [Bacilli bacterium]
MAKKPVIDYGWEKLPKYLFILIIIILFGGLFIINYDDKSDASYIAKELSLYTRLNIDRVEYIRTKDLNKDIMYGIESKANLYSNQVDSINHYMGSVEVYKNESFSLMRRTTLKNTMKYISELTNDENYINNRTYDIILYQNVILKLNKNIANKQEVIDDFKEIINNVKLQNQRTLTSREREEKTKELNKEIEKKIDKDFEKFKTKPFFYEF